MENGSGNVPQIVASTGDVYCCSIEDSREREQNPQVLHGAVEDERETNYFKHAEWQVLSPNKANSNISLGRQMALPSLP